MLIVYAYQGCSTCRQALKWLRERKIGFEERAIRETPPTVAELSLALAALGGDLKRLCNTSGQDYRALGWKDKLPAMTQAEALDALSRNGNLVKRPFLIDSTKKLVLVGFKEAEWTAAFG